MPFVSMQPHFPTSQETPIPIARCIESSRGLLAALKYALILFPSVLQHRIEYLYLLLFFIPAGPFMLNLISLESRRVQPFSITAYVALARNVLLMKNNENCSCELNLTPSLSLSLCLCLSSSLFPCNNPSEYLISVFDVSISSSSSFRRKLLRPDNQPAMMEKNSRMFHRLGPRFANIATRGRI